MELNLAPHGQPLPMDGGPPLVVVRWLAQPWLLSLAVALLLPALGAYCVAFLRAVGLAAPYAAVQAVLPAADASLLLRRTVGWAVTMVGPAVAGVLGLLACVSAEFRLGQGELAGHIRLATGVSPHLQLLGVVVMLVGLVLFAAMAGHLVADGYACSHSVSSAC